MNLRILGALLRKEITLMRRNPIIPKIILIMPVMVMLVLPLAATLDVRNVTVAVVDNDLSPLSRRMIADMDASDVISVVSVMQTHKEAIRLIEHGDADVIVSVPYRFSRDLSGIDIEVNGTNAVKGMLGSQYVAASLGGTLNQWMQESGASPTSETISVINRFNPTLNFRNFMIPALMVVLLIIICGFLPALNLVNEKESGTIEAINVTPVSRLTFVLSKLIPFWIVGLLVVSEGLVIGWAVYGLRPEGSIAAIYLAVILFSFLMSGLGVAIANRSDTMSQSIFVMFAVIMIFQLMGGLFTPISSMPEWAQIITYAVPPRYFNEIMRAVYLKGTTVAELSGQFICLAVFAVAACLLAAATYRKRC